MSEFKLLPCPFCGADLTRDANGTAHHRHPDTPCFFMPFAIISGNPKEIEAWNRRSPPPELVEAWSRFKSSATVYDHQVAEYAWSNAAHHLVMDIRNMMRDEWPKSKKAWEDHQ